MYHLEDLQQAYRKGQKFKFLFFWGHTPPAGGSINQSCFSQWFTSPFTVDHEQYSCTEQYMMAEKARLFGDKEMLKKIMEAGHPKAMKAYGRAVTPFDAKLWDQTCYDIVKRGNFAKFTQNPELGSFLKATQNRILVEASPADRIWGIGMAKDHPEVENPMKWRGNNLLGFALAEVRDLMLAEAEERAK
ncbi:hypothetical protein GCM10010912_42380 [Paenibacillus albidus]|uniref:NADAR domain-containing protein n=1 Tax=Paenibacillus albidus TaxID=2041023 RepID=A0A917CP76_9BACL|nr:NADAR family protein [Paenibacillus albidus]GGF92880.1 hypothetical protein GCM10010912_42380 [Paenibacillus albidus]